MWAAAAAIGRQTWMRSSPSIYSNSPPTSHGRPVHSPSAMDEEDRPRKLPKLGHDDDVAHQELGPAMTGAASADDVSEQTSAPIPESSKTEQEVVPTLDDGPNPSEAVPDNATEDTTPKISKNQLKKLRRKEKWANERELRKDKRKEKMAEKRERRRLMVEQARENGGEEAVKELRKQWESTRSKHKRSSLLPLTFVIDCGYDDLMLSHERISLASQLTRSYSENSRAAWRSNLMFSSFDKLLKERFDTVLTPYKNWKGIKTIPEDFVHAAELAKAHMASPQGGKLAGPFAEKADTKPEDGEVIYLSSDSENTLTELKPYSTYIIGGLVDKNRHKAICYKHAVEKGIKTAKLPIGDYIQMASRSVLTTNHVVDIMLRWLELGDWGEAFMKVLPQRKGGKLRAQSNDMEGSGEAEEEQDGDDAAALAEVEAAGEGVEEGEEAAEDDS
ncbi:tRNA (guanine(9)-N1)-methyltransferase [Penicillium hispanicum]|uniref:tRNA (guanine(9)-N1)-methyltransferase n=1 Tax=Penicillium hispanicum TaxID=1080232 RepID=UPI002540C5C6|nr:tRNA (guanine(9)-N1)-methyltransferase [Penicillium hispanicum]KAJ5594168.1 tRNA (guanine(9)-N1)-methyltransferase [Penicillium hispanicum]